MTKKLIREHVKSIWFDGWTRKNFNDLFDEGSLTHSNLLIVSESYGYDGGCDFYLSGERMETDAEYEARLLAESKEAAEAEKKRLKIEARERKEFERLKKKFG
jgi:hypothetical protein